MNKTIIIIGLLSLMLISVASAKIVWVNDFETAKLEKSIDDSKPKDLIIKLEYLEDECIFIDSDKAECHVTFRIVGTELESTIIYPVSIKKEDLIEECKKEAIKLYDKGDKTYKFKKYNLTEKETTINYKTQKVINTSSKTKAYVPPVVPKVYTKEKIALPKKWFKW